MNTGPAHDELQGFGIDARRAVVAAQDSARALGHDRVGTEHLLLGLLADAEVGRVLREAGVTESAARSKVIEAVPTGASSERGALTRSARCDRALGRAARFARAAHADHVGASHLLLAVLDVEGTAGQVLRGLGVDLEQVRSAVAGPPAPEDEAAAVDESTPAPSPAPRCPGCDTPLTSALAGTRVAVDVEGGGRQAVVALSCPTCGALLGLTPDS